MLARPQFAAMAFLRLRRKSVLVFGLIALTIALTSNFLIFFGLSTSGIKSEFGQIKNNLDELKENLGELKHDIGDIRIPGVPKKPWHSNEKTESPLEPSDNHPITGLMMEADKAWRKYEDSRSKSLRETVRTYRRRYGRHPPPGFKEWYKFARKRNVHNIDDFGQIMDDIRPFWAIEPKVLRNLAAHMWKDDAQGVSGIHIRNHKVVQENNGNWRSETLITLIKKFVKYLPDMDIALNRLDQPRVVVPWEDMQKLLDQENQGRRTPPETLDEFTSSMQGLLDLDGNATETQNEDPGWFPAHGQQYMDVASLACPPESPARNTHLSTKELTEVDGLYKDRRGGLITNFNHSTDLCIVGPQIKDMHGLLFTSSSMIPTKRLVPIFGECKVNVNSDILFPANMYWKHDERYDYDNKHDIDWENKKDVMLWRGVTSGGAQNADNWRRMHRQRLVMDLNSTLLADKEVRILTEQPEKKGEYENYREYHPSAFVGEHTDVGFVEAWGCVPDCGFYDGVWTLKPQTSLSDQFQNKFLVDVDGHSFSGRWIAFLESKSLGFKATIFREWFDSRLFAWRHFIPMDNRYDDVYTLLTYFLGVGVDPENSSSNTTVASTDKAHVPSHSAEGKRIANQGREWAKKVLRRDDIEVCSQRPLSSSESNNSKIYMFRLLLEYGRVIDDNRDRIGYSGDGGEFDKYDGVSPVDETHH